MPHIKTDAPPQCQKHAMKTWCNPISQQHHRQPHDSGGGEGKRGKPGGGTVVGLQLRGLRFIHPAAAQRVLGSTRVPDTTTLYVDS